MSTKKIQIIGSPYVAYNEQTLTDEQKAQVRENIGAVSENTLANYETYITLQMYGAVGDGVADDTAAVKAAIADAKEQNKPIHVAVGTYNLTDIIDIEDVEIIGVSPEKCVFKMVGQATTREHFIKCMGKVTVKNIQFKQSYDGAIFGMYNCSNSVIEDCIFYVEEGVPNNGYFDLYVGNNNIRVNNCKFLNYSKQDAGGIWVRNGDSTTVSENIVFEDCVFKHATKDEIVAVWGWRGVVKDVSFSGCNFETIDSSYYPTHMLTLGMDGESYNLTLDNCEIYHNYANGNTIKSNIENNGIIKNVNVNNCYFYIDGIEDTTSSFSSSLGVLRINNCVIEVNNHFLFTGVEVNNCDITSTHNYFGQSSVINNSNIMLKNSCKLSNYGLELHNCVIDFNNQTLYHMLFQPLNNNLKIIVNNCEFKNLSGYDNSCRFFFNTQSGTILEITNSKIAYCNIYSSQTDFNLTMFGNVITGKQNEYWGSSFVSNVHDNIVNGVYCMHGLKTSADDYINSLITAATELPSVTTSDSGKFLRVSTDGTWVAETIPQIEEVAF